MEGYISLGSSSVVTGSSSVAPTPSPLLVASWILEMCRLNRFETMCPRFREYYWNLRLEDGPHYLLVNGERVERFDCIDRAIMELELRHEDDESLVTQQRMYSFNYYSFTENHFTFKGDARFDIVSFEPC